LIARRRRGLWLLSTAAIVACGDVGGPRKATAPTDADPASAVVVTSDLANFWQAYDAGGKTGDPAPFQSMYLDRASTGLRDFRGLRSVTAASLAQMVRTFPRYFAELRAINLRLTANDPVLARIRENYRRIEEVYPPAVFPPVTLLIGRFSTAGTTSTNGMLIGTELYGVAPSTPLDELLAFQRDNATSLDNLPIIVAHEHAHILQSRNGALWGTPNSDGGSPG
jgi:hypothetical protein